MLLITPYHIQAYAKCPKYCHLNYYEISSPIKNIETKIIEVVIKSSYAYHLKHEKLPPWKLIIKWTEKHLSDNPITSSYDYKDTKGILQKLHIWYYNFYIPINRYGLTNLPVAVGLGTNVTFYDTIDVVLLGDNISLVDIVYVEDLASYTNRSFYNDILFHLKTWIAVKSTDTIPDIYYRIVVGKQSLKIIKTNINQGIVSNIEKTIRHICSGIKENIFYPSYSIQCDTCNQLKNCNI